MQDSIVSGDDSKKVPNPARFNYKDTINESTKDGYNSSINRAARPGEKE